MRKKLLLLLVLFMVGCQNKKEIVSNEKSSVYYEIFVGSFADSNQDGIGDLQGIIQKLPYLQKLGIKGIWLTPIHPSGSYHKYDVLDYYGIDPQFGTMEDFEELVQVAKEYQIEIILDLVLNHTSEDHPWFLEAKKNQLNNTCEGQDSKCDYYLFTNEKGNNTTKIQENLYYEAIFTSSMPDLKLDNPEVRQEIENIVSFWLDKGIKGFRLDAALHYYGSSDKNNEFLSWFNQTVKNKKGDAFLVAEVWSDEKTIQRHYESGLDSFFNFTLSDPSGKVVTSIRSGKGASLARWLASYNEELKRINPKAMDTPFLSNHDQGRSGGYFAKDLPKQKMMASTYLLAPGIPFIYYGEEIGMLGSGNDPNQRLPMVWGASIDGMTTNPPGVNYNGEFASSVSDQEKEKDSLLNHYREVIAIRNRFSVFERGMAEAVDVNDENIFALTLRDEKELVMVLHNYSAEEKTVEVDFNTKNYYLIGQGSKKGNEIKLSAYSSIVLEGELQ